ncbi:MAG: hypothetical protein KDC85_22565 [Saprospiraceae bacterium]|nr:hypothetical protein [Saprospiraceae bacterium]MCB9324575.1 hypothetical protein [Lewinellaceae bacterium]
MKLRCSQNSLRLRVLKSETETLKRGEELVEKVHVGTAVFSYGLTQSESGAVYATFEKGHIEVHIPKNELAVWLDTEQVGIEVKQPLEDGGTLQILIEKDFPCVTRTTEDKSDTFRELASKNDQAC